MTNKTQLSLTTGFVEMRTKTIYLEAAIKPTINESWTAKTFIFES